MMAAQGFTPARPPTAGKTMEHMSRKRGKCPICGKVTVESYRPFCSKRCADVDLAHWLRGDYRVPTDERPNVGDAPPLEDDEA